MVMMMKGLLCVLLATPLHAALLRAPISSAMPSLRVKMCAERAIAVDVASAASDIRSHDLIEAWFVATERGDASGAMELVTDDFYYQTHRATSDSRDAAEERLHAKTPSPAKITEELHAEGPGIYVREIVVKPIPFVTVAVRQEFTVRNVDGAPKLSKAVYIKL